MHNIERNKQMPLFDTHAHYDAEQFDADREELLSSMPQNGVEYIINPSCTVADAERIIALCEKFPFLYCAVGIHPENIDTAKEGDIDRLRQLAKHPKVKAIGEIGLDYYWDDTHKEEQKYWLKAQLALAEELNLPVIIHERSACADCMEIMKDFKGRAVYHCFGGSPETAKEVLRMGHFISFTGVITFKNAKKAVAAAQVVPLDRLMIETDSPYMAPEPYRGKRNSSLYVYRMAEKLAEIKGVSAEEMARITLENGKRFFGIETEEEQL